MSQRRAAHRLTVNDWREAARRSLPRFVFEYLDGAAEDGLGLVRNRTALDAVTLAPRVLRDTRQIDPSITLLGQTWAQPFGIAPTGLNGLVRPGGDLMGAAAAQAMGVPFVLSTASNERLEAVREAAPNGQLWLQLYVMEDHSIAEQMLRRARLARFDALVLTVDVAVSGLRERDVRNGFKLPFKPTPSLVLDLLRHPAWSMRLAAGGAPQFANLVENPGARMSAQAQAALLARAMDRGLDWASLRWLRQHWDGPLILKGILHPDDARRALEEGVDALIVSNHGARQLDLAPASITQLPAIVDAVHDRLPVLMDSGIRRGADVARALALGAHAVLIGRPVLYGLAVDGQAGVQSVLQTLADELERNLILLGEADVGSLRARRTQAA
ncbi:alpha-hydroxy acid oxidase [Hydrogenophaga sp. A37]|uniref:alpha-hydroxy acid oxidase n=1 Tax=Hydrogenophaga sp. A37 TaxID=1945864 RepID=UPI000985A526|nr:alpha-hydroxy acid oxidase [Hydrogenophaga sp. A37]OOG85206.1 alpha-hydroxy-acid oxidizing enzyme [Hydrogenophaga sp. A37]